MAEKWNYPAIAKGFWYIFSLPAQSRGAKTAKVIIVISLAGFVGNMILPGKNVPYWSLTHCTDMLGELLDIVAWYVVLWYVRQRDELRTALKARETIEVACKGCGNRMAVTASSADRT